MVYVFKNLDHDKYRISYFHERQVAVILRRVLGHVAGIMAYLLN